MELRYGSYMHRNEIQLRPRKAHKTGEAARKKKDGTLQSCTTQDPTATTQASVMTSETQQY